LSSTTGTRDSFLSAGEKLLTAKVAKEGARSTRRKAVFRLPLTSGEPDLVGNDCHHEQQVESKGPQDEEFGAFEVAAGDQVFFGFDELIVFE